MKTDQAGQRRDASDRTETKRPDRRGVRNRRDAEDAEKGSGENSGFAVPACTLSLRLCGFSLFLLACAPTTSGAAAADVARGRAQSASGADVFANECARCHGQRGEGLAGVPAVLGPGALPLYPRDNASPGSFAMSDPEQLQIQQQTRPAGAAWRDPFRNAESLYNFVSTHLPKSRASALGPDDYWAVVTFMLSVQGSRLPPEGVTANNASTITIPGQ